MYVRAQSGGWLMCQDYDDPHEHSVVKKLHSSGRTVFAEIALAETRVWNRKGHLNAAFISRYIDEGHTKPYSEERFYLWGWDVTEITFNVHSLNARTIGRWTISFYEKESPNEMMKSPSNDFSKETMMTSNEFTGEFSQRCLVYDNRTGNIIHTQEFIPVSPDELKPKQDLEKMAINNISPSMRNNIESLSIFHPERSDIELINRSRIDPMLKYKINLQTHSLMTEYIDFDIETNRNKKEE